MVHLEDAILNESAVSVLDAIDLEPVTEPGPDDGTDGAVHARRIAAGSKNTDFRDHLYFLEFRSL